MVGRWASALLMMLATSAVAQMPAPLPSDVQPVPGDPKDAWKEKEDRLRGKGLMACAVGDKVMVSFEGDWLPGEVIAVDTAASYPCKVHMSGKPESTDASFAAWMLRAPH